jgi:hypothetical protein
MSTVNPVRLPLEIKRNGATYVFVKRGLKSLVYARTVPNQDPTYEVFKIKIRKASNVKGQLIPPGEIFPHDEAFGYWAWQSYTMQGALKYFDKIERKEL